MLQKFLKFALLENLFSKEEHILLGVSGGIDSMVLFDLFSRSQFKFGIAHCNFGLRGDESDSDEKMVKASASEKEIPFHSQTFETKKYARNNGISIQMAARELRLDWFRSVCNSEGYTYVATAHHKDDQNETFFINLIRGSGISGMHGILPRREIFIHPLMFAHRKDILAYAREHNIAYREDSSNSKTDYLRNKIRHNIIPLFTDIKPGFPEILSENIESLRSVENIYRHHLKEVWNSISYMEGDLVKLHIKNLMELPEPVTYLFEFIQDFGFNFSDATQIITSFKAEPGKTFYSPSHRLLIDRKFILIQQMNSISDAGDEYILNLEDGERIEPISLQVKTFPKTAEFEILPNSNIAFLDSNLLKGQLKLRKWKEGDFFFPLGMRGRKLISDFFTDQKFSLYKKENTWLLTREKDIVWIIGHRIDNRFKITEKTSHILQINYLPNE